MEHLKKLFFAATVALTCSVCNAQMSGYDQWRWNTQHYFPGQNFNQVGPPTRYYSSFNGPVYIGQRSYSQPTPRQQGGTINYLTPPRRNAMTIQDSPLPQRNHAYTRSKKAKP